MLHDKRFRISIKDCWTLQANRLKIPNHRRRLNWPEWFRHKWQFRTKNWFFVLFREPILLPCTCIPVDLKEQTLFDFVNMSVIREIMKINFLPNLDGGRSQRETKKQVSYSSGTSSQWWRGEKTVITQWC